MRTIGGATTSSSTDPTFLSLADRIEFLMPRMTWRDAAMALSMQKVACLSSFPNSLVLNADSCRGMFFLLLSLRDSLKGATRRSVMVA